MRVFFTVVVLINFSVDLLLLLTVDHIRGQTTKTGRYCLAASVGGIYGGCCIFPGLAFLGYPIWRLVILAAIGVIAFGCRKSSVHGCALFVLLSMALGGIMQAMGDERISSLLLGAALLLGLCVFGFHGWVSHQELVEVELFAQGKKEKLLALRDTGNGLRDPVTGQQVLVADAQSARTLFGLDRQQLRCPIETVAAGIVPGLRLIPYRTVGQSAGMLVAIRLEHVRIGKWQGSTLVAFAPEGLGENQAYRALTGGMV